MGFESIPAWEMYSKLGVILVELSQMTGLSKPMFLKSIKIQSAYYTFENNDESSGDNGVL